MTQAKPDTPEKLTRKRVVLLATNNSHSIIGEIVDGKTNTIAYSAYGEQSAQQDIQTRLGFNGQLRERSIGWYLLGNGYRAYNPRLMRFHSPDSWSPFGRGGLNAYMYCVGDPVNRSDPTGHNPFVAAALFFKDKVSQAFSGYKTHPEFNVDLNKATNFFREAQSSKPDVNGGGISDFLKAGAPILTTHRRVSLIGKYPPQDVGNNNNNRVNWSRTIPPVVVIRPPVPKTVSPPRSVSFNKSVKLHDGPTNPAPKIEHNQLQGGEVLPRQNHWPSSESLSSNGSSWTNASSPRQGSSISISSDRYERAAELREMDEMIQRLDALSRWSSRDSFHSAVSSIRSQ